MAGSPLWKRYWTGGLSGRKIGGLTMESIRPVVPIEGKKPDQHPPRTCETEGCSVRLSLYNPGPDCYQHSPVRYPRTRGIKKGGLS